VPTFFIVQVIIKVSPGSKTVPSETVWETHSAWSIVSVPGVPLPSGTVRVGVGWAGVGLAGSGVSVGQRHSVGAGVRARFRVTCASTVEATSVRKGFISTVGELVGVEVPQADRKNKTSPTPMTAIVFFVCDI
jgi:hypothetical protein